MTIYLIWGLSLALLGLITLFGTKRHQRLALISGLLAAPFGLLDYFFTQDYWTPSHVLGPGISIEGVLFSFGNGIFLWLLACLPFGDRVFSDAQVVPLLRRAAVYSSFAFIIMALLWDRGAGLAGFSLMTSTIVALILVSIALLAHRPDLIFLMMSGAVSFGLFYAGQIAILALFAPEFPSVWMPSVQQGPTFLGFPAEEMIWAVTYGFAWAGGIGYGSNVRIEGKGK